MAYRVLITGSRDWSCDALAESILDRLIAKHGAADLVIIHGACPTGADAAFDRACVERHVAVHRFPADWAKHGKAAGPKRNAEMVEARPDICLAFHPNLAASKGTGDCAWRALKAGIPTWWYANDVAAPVRQRLASKEDQS